MNFGALTRVRDLKDVIRGMKDLAVGLQRLSFDNFQGEEWSGTIASSTEESVQHRLQKVPTRFVVTDSAGTSLIVRGDADWTTSTVSFKNIDGSNSWTGKIRILP